MSLSPLVTSVGINLGLCFLFFMLYSLLRKQTSYVTLYAPRLVGKKGSEARVDFNWKRLLPSTVWLKKAWETSEEKLLSESGLNAVVFMRIFVLSFKVFIIGGIIGIIFLLPINFMGNQLDYDFSDLPNKSLDSFSISNVEDGSNRLWVHFCAAYFFTGVVCYLLYKEYSYISSKRVSYFDSSERRPHQFTIIVRNIPLSPGRSVSDIVENFFSEYHPSTYLSHTVVRRTSKLQEFNDIPAAFVSFKSRLGAAMALNIQQGIDPTEWVIERALDPREVYLPYFLASCVERRIYNLVVVIACVIFTIFFFIPVGIVQGLSHLDQLEYWFPFLKGILRLTFISQVITGYLPSLILQLSLFCVPRIMIYLSSIQGCISLSQREKSACNKVWWFTVWNAFLAIVISGTALYPVNVFLEPKDIPKVLAHGVPGQASFFIAYVVTSGWTSLLSELFRLMPLICSFCRWPCSEIDEDFEVPSIPYHSEIPRILFFGLLGIILPFIVVYYCLGYIIYRNQVRSSGLIPLIHFYGVLLVWECYFLSRTLLNVYAPKFETGGRLWPMVHNSMIFSLILMHIIAIGIFGLKKLPLASILTIPLPVFTFLFYKYCRERFLPIFQEYPTECLVRKDRADQNDQTLVEFYRELETAYEDPVQYSQNKDGLNSPLLQAQMG